MSEKLPTDTEGSLSTQKSLESQLETVKDLLLGVTTSPGFEALDPQIQSKLKGVIEEVLTVRTAHVSTSGVIDYLDRNDTMRNREKITKVAFSVYCNYPYSHNDLVTFKNYSIPYNSETNEILDEDFYWSLGEIKGLISKQAALFIDNEPLDGDLRVNRNSGYDVFWVKNKYGKVASIGVYWDNKSKSWGMRYFSVPYSNWQPSDRILFRKSNN